MKIGITYGGYCPLHQGHLDVIMRAKKECDHCFVVVCGYDDEPRAKELDLPLDKRYRIIKNFLEDELVTVIKVDDTELGIDESYSLSNWHIWMNAIYKQTNEIMAKRCPNDDFHYVWYLSEATYNKSMHEVDPNINVVLLDRSKNVVSGTLCRQYPLEYWAQITQPFRAYLSHNILIAGTASEGKTTLCRDIGKYFSIPYSYEKGRDICHLKSDPEMNVKDFMYNLYEQHKYNEELICSPQNPGIFLSDTDNMVTLMYARAYAGREGFNLSKDDFELLYSMAAAYARTDKWDKVFLLAPHQKGLVDDGERYMADSDYAIRADYFEFLKGLYDRFGIKYEVLNGTYYENFLTVKNYIKGLYE